MLTWFRVSEDALVDLLRQLPSTRAGLAKVLAGIGTNGRAERQAMSLLAPHAASQRIGGGWPEADTSRASAFPLG
jgi:predicted RNA-binding Zn ribbon-like protein